MSESKADYVHGHHESVLRSHSARTAANSAAYLLPHLQPHMKMLDVGCGPGTITIDLARLVPEGSIIGIEPVSEPLEHARANATEASVSNVDFVVGDANVLDFADATFDVTHSHQVLQHVRDPVKILKEMKRVTKLGGLVACSVSDWGGFIVYPPVPGMDKFLELFPRISEHTGGEQYGGRRLRSWAHDAGFEWKDMTSSASTFCYSTPEERAWWSSVWTDRLVDSSLATTALESGLASREDLDVCVQAWRAWGAKEDGWFAFIKGEVLCRV